MNPENTRVTAVREHYGLSKADFARRVGLDPSTLNKAESGPSKPGLDTLSAILRAYPEISTDWMVFGVEPMIRPQLPISPPDVAAAQRETRLARAESARLKTELAAKATYIQHLELELEKFEGGLEQPEGRAPFTPRPRPTGTRASARAEQRRMEVATPYQYGGGRRSWIDVQVTR